MTEYTVYENGREINFKPKSTKQWKDTVKGLNASMDCVDGPQQEIVVKTKAGKVIYKQEKDNSYRKMIDQIHARIMKERKPLHDAFRGRWKKK